MADPLTKQEAGNEFGQRPDIRAGRVTPMQEVGTTGTAIYAGHIVSVEKDASLVGAEKYRTFDEILANVTIVGAGVRFFLNLVSAAKWRVEAPEESGQEGKDLAERVDKILNGMDTSWHRIVRKAAMYRFRGFAWLEWIAKRDKDGTIVFRNIENRPQVTIERWDTSDSGEVLAALQRSPQTQVEVAIPREKSVYLVEDSLTDSPEGMGLFRHIVEASKRLRKYEQLEGFGYEGDLRGTPIARAPITELLKAVQAGTLKKEDFNTLMQPLRDFITNHIKNPSLGMLLDSEVWRARDAAATPSTAPQWALELLQGGEYSLAEVAAAIERTTMEIARVLGVEHLLLGSSSAGSFALSKDKSNNFALVVDSTLKELREQFEKDLLGPLWLLNGWDPELKPKLVTDTNVTRDIEQLSAVIRDLATAGVVLDREDDLVTEVLNLMGLPRLIGQVTVDPDAQLMPNGEPAPDDEIPEEPEDEGETPDELEPDAIDDKPPTTKT